MCERLSNSHHLMT